MDRATALGLTAKQTIQLGHATHITQDDNVGVGVGQIARLALAHGGANVSIFEGKEATKAAAFLSAIQFNEFRAGNMGQQLAWLAINAQFAQQMATGMIGHFGLHA